MGLYSVTLGRCTVDEIVGKGDQAMKTMALLVTGVLWLGVWQQEKKPGEEKAAVEKNAEDTSKLVNPVKASTMIAPFWERRLISNVVKNLRSLAKK